MFIDLHFELVNFQIQVINLMLRLQLLRQLLFLLFGLGPLVMLGLLWQVKAASLAEVSLRSLFYDLLSDFSVRYVVFLEYNVAWV